ncbi:MAG TPA: serine/threonine-protein kinase [Byssovorax sp.]|jgi:serine/threonine-protein kinase
MGDASPEVIGERYRVVRLLGSGGMGAVYEAVDATNGKSVAVKVISDERAQKPTDVARFDREARAAGAIRSPHIVEVLDSGVDPTTRVPYIVMELLDGEDLSALLTRLGPISPELAVRVALQAAMGLAEAHAAHVVHRDVKPGNLFLAKAGGGKRVVKVVDFGIAKFKGDGIRGDGQTAGLTKSGGILGSPLYMSPEQARGKKAIDERSDVWSLGVVIYTAITGAPPHRDTEELGDLIIRICSELAEPIQDRAPWVVPEIAAIVHRALRFSPDERFRTAAEMGAALAAALPDAGDIDEAMLVSLGDDERGKQATRLAEELVATTDRRAREGATTARPGSGATSSTVSVHATTALSTRTGSATQSSSPNRTPLAIAIGAALVMGVVAVRELGASRAAAPSASAPVVASAPSAPPAERVARLVVIPSGAKVDVDGAPQPITDGVVTLRGAIGSVHRVHASALGVDATTDVVVTDSGAVPAKIEVPAPAPSPAATASASATTTPRAAPPSRATAKPPVDIRTQR